MHLQQDERLQPLLKKQGQVILEIDGVQPEMGHEVLWVIRDVLSGEILLARPLLSAPGLKLHSQLTTIAESLERVTQTDGPSFGMGSEPT